MRLDAKLGKLAWRWRNGETVTKSDLGSPESSTGYALCIYDGAALRLRAVAPAAGQCSGKPCWRSTRKGFEYKDKTPDGRLEITLKEGAAEHGKIAVTGEGSRLNLVGLSLPMTTPVRVQLKRSGSTRCWEAKYSSTIRNDRIGGFKATSD